MCFLFWKKCKCVCATDNKNNCGLSTSKRNDCKNKIENKTEAICTFANGTYQWECPQYNDSESLAATEGLIKQKIWCARW